MHSTIEKALRFIRIHDLIRPDDRVLAGVSGGADSMALLSICADLRNRGLIGDLVCVHVHHHLRPEADGDQAFVLAAAETWKVPCVTRDLDVTALARRTGSSLETAGREGRLEVFADLARERGCRAVALGHHKNDNAETLVQRLARGTGLRGLCGIWPVREHLGTQIVRPLLGLTREELIAYLRQQGLAWREDRSNRDRRFRRNRIRHDLLPALQARSQGDLVERLAELSRACQGLYQRQVLPQAKAILEDLRSVAPGRGLRLDTEPLADRSPIVQCEVIRQVLGRMGLGERSVTRGHYRAVMDLIQGRGPAVSLPGGLRAARRGRDLVFEPVTSTDNGLPQEVTLRCPGLTRFGSYRITVECLDVEPGQVTGMEFRDTPWIEQFDADRLHGPLTIRCRRPGDRFVPLGRHTEQKVGKFLTKAGVRAEFVIRDTQGIVWVCPARISETAKVGPGTRRVVRVRVSEATDQN